MPVDSMAAVESVVARPRYIHSGDRPLFTWHHRPPPQVRRAAGIVLCPALGYEYMSSYRACRMLAERLAAIGFDTLRLDYDGTGNSAGDPEDPDRTNAWVRSVVRAIAEARQLSSFGPIALIGLRAGALLALQAAAAAGGVERLVLWSPFSSGRAFVRELKAITRLSGHDEPGEAEDDSAINAEGHVFTRGTLESLARWTLDDIPVRPARDVLLVDRDDRPVEQLVGARLQSLGSVVTRIHGRGTAELLLPPHLAKVPEDTLDEIATWFRPWHESSAPPPAQSAIPDDVRSAQSIRDTYRERAVRFGPDDRLFGILAGPAGDSSMAPAIVLFNTGGGHLVGPHRLYVSLAREWAAAGHLVLRFDLGGLGDSLPPYPTEAQRALRTPATCWTTRAKRLPPGPEGSAASASHRRRALLGRLAGVPGREPGTRCRRHRLGQSAALPPGRRPAVAQRGADARALPAVDARPVQVGESAARGCLLRDVHAGRGQRLSPGTSRSA